MRVNVNVIQSRTEINSKNIGRHKPWIITIMTIYLTDIKQNWLFK